MYSFFVQPEQIFEKEIKIIGKDVNHIKNVLRMKVGEKININNGQDSLDYQCEIFAFDEEEVQCHILYCQENDLELQAKITLFQGLPKSDKMELIIQKCVELGAYEFVPVATARAVVKLDEKKAKSKVKRWQAISEAAAKQSKRKIIPEVKLPCSYQEAISRAKEFDKILIPYELKKGMQDTKEIIESIKPGESVGVFIGPEGGFSENEIKMATQIGAIPISLGKRILRTETAGFTTLAWIMYQLELQAEFVDENSKEI
jgi:16S rRNA (uracil1498-N3)-methyltransferase